MARTRSIVTLVRLIAATAYVGLATLETTPGEHPYPAIIPAAHGRVMSAPPGSARRSPMPWSNRSGS
jgi:hypothetical protein